MWELPKTLIDALLSALKSRPLWALGVLFVFSSALFLTAGLIMDGAWGPFIYGTAYLILISVFAALAFNRDKPAFEGWRGHAYRWISRLSPVLLAITGIFFLTWLSFNAHRYFSEYDYYCEGGEDTESSSKAEEGTGTGKVEKTWFAGLTGIERAESTCNAERYVLTWTARPMLTIAKGENQPISLTLPFSHRRSSCSGRSKGEFSACLPSGGEITKAEIRNLSVRNGGIDYDKVADTNDDKFSRDNSDANIWNKTNGSKQCFIVPWNSASGGRTGIGECRYHGLISFDVVLSGTINVPETSEELAPGDPVPKHYQGIMVGDFIPLEVTPEVNDVTSSYENGAYMVDLELRKKRHMRELVIWRDQASKDKNESTCISLSYNETPPGLNVRNKCATGLESVK